MLLPKLRFGAALASLRTGYGKEIKRQAWQELSETLKQPLRLPGDSKISKKMGEKSLFQEGLCIPSKAAVAASYLCSK